MGGKEETILQNAKSCSVPQQIMQVCPDHLEITFLFALQLKISSIFSCIILGGYFSVLSFKSNSCTHSPPLLQLHCCIAVSVI